MRGLGVGEKRDEPSVPHLEEDGARVMRDPRKKAPPSTQVVYII